MASHAGNSVSPISPHVIGNAFVQQYYHILHRSPELVHKFYQDSSILGRPDSNGTMTTVTTMHAINEQILSMEFSNCFTEIETADTQLSHTDGVLIVVTGSLMAPDNVRRRFTQSFFLAPQENGGYFVRNDVFRFISERPLGEINQDVVNHSNENTQSANMAADPEPSSVKECPVTDLLAAENSTNEDEAINPSVNDCSTVENNVSVEPHVQMTKEDTEKIPEAAPAPPAPSLKDVTKKSYASIVKVMKEGPPPVPIAKPKPAPKPTTKAAETLEKTVPVPAKSAQAADTMPPNGNNVSENNSPDEQGYSVFVKDLPFNATAEMVEEEFKKFGAIKPGGIQVRNHKTDRFCFGFVEFESQQSMQAAIEASPICFGGKEVYIEEKRTTTRVVNGVVTRGDNGNVGGGRFQSGRGGYRGDSFRGRGGGFINNDNYRGGDNLNRRNDFRNRNDYSSRGRGPQGNGYHQNGNGYHQQRPFQNGNGRFARFNGPRQAPVAA